MKFPKKCPHRKQTFYDWENTPSHYNLGNAQQIHRRVKWYGAWLWAGLELTEPLPKHEIRHIVQLVP